MLGDAGANAAGVIAGWLLAVALSAWWWALAVYVLFAFAMNIASEKISFSAVIIQDTCAAGGSMVSACMRGNRKSPPTPTT